MKRKTYKIDNEDKVLISEEEYDVNGNVIYFKDHQSDPVFEKRTEYNSKGYIETEIESMDGVETDKIVVKYDDDGEVIEQSHFISGELYEKILTDKNDKGFTRITYQDDSEVEKLIREDLEDKNYTNRFYAEGELEQIQQYEYDTHSRTGVTKVFDADNNLISIQKVKFDENERVIEFQQLNENEKLLEERLTEYEGELISKEVNRRFTGSAFEQIISYAYDENGNQLKKEVYSPSGDMIEFHYSKYDDENRLIAENGSTTGSFQGVYGTYANRSEFDLEYDYM